uniref:Uncharacterized protein n=1 Tax=Fagus sylvatica TaxID=28930 RepID=A0A2N9I7P2_FAGSY
MDESSSKHAEEKQSGPLPMSEASPVVRPPPIVKVVDMEVLEDPLRLEKLTKEKREVVVELEKLMAELAARDDDMKVAMEDKDKVVADLQHLVGQIEGAKATAVSKYRASKDFDDNNTRYFLSGLETFRKQVGERFPDLYFLSSSYMTMMTRSWRELMGLKLMTRLMMLLQNDLVFMLSFLDVT